MTGRQMLQTTVRSIKYDFIAFSGHLFMDADCCCDMTECIEFFKRIDPNVIYILTTADREHDTSYRLIDGQWVATPQQAALRRIERA